MREEQKRQDESHVGELLSAYIDGRLTPGERLLVETHLPQCEACRADLASLQQTIILLQSLPAVPAPRPFYVYPNMLPAKAAAPRWAAWLRPAWGYAALRLATTAAMLMLVVLVAADAAGNAGFRAAAPAPQSTGLTARSEASPRAALPAAAPAPTLVPAAVAAAADAAATATALANAAGAGPVGPVPQAAPQPAPAGTPAAEPYALAPTARSAGGEKSVVTPPPATVAPGAASTSTVMVAPMTAGGPGASTAATPTPPLVGFGGPPPAEDEPSPEPQSPAVASEPAETDATAGGGQGLPAIRVAEIAAGGLAAALLAATLLARARRRRN